PLGLVLGLAFWQTSQVFPLELAAVVWLVWRRAAVLRLAWVAAPLALLGALPWIVWNAGHHWASLHLVSGAQSSYLWRLRLLASPVLPAALGLRRPSSEWLLPFGVAAAIYMGLVVLFALGVF